MYFKQNSIYMNNNTIFMIACILLLYVFCLISTHFKNLTPLVISRSAIYSLNNIRDMFNFIS